MRRQTKFCPTLYISSQVPIKANPSHQEKPSKTPMDVATPLPPLKLKNTGYRCPINAARPMLANNSTDTPKKLATIHGNEAFKQVAQ